MSKPQLPIRGPAQASTGIPNAQSQGQATVSLSGATDLVSAAFPSAGDTRPRLRLLIRPLDGGIWVTTNGEDPVSGGAGWYIPALEAQEFAGADVVKAITDTTVGTGAATVCVWELGPEE